MNHLAGSVHTCIGPPRGHGTGGWRGIKSQDGLVETLLNGVGVALPLPAVERSPVVLQTKGNPAA